MSRKRKKKNLSEEQSSLPIESDIDELGQAILDEGGTIDGDTGEGEKRSAPEHRPEMPSHPPDDREAKPGPEGVDELFAMPHAYTARPPITQRIIPIVIAFIIVGALFSGAGGLFVASELLSAKDEAVRVRQSFDSIKTSVAELDFRGALTEFPKGKESIQSLIRRVDRFSYFSWVPLIGPRISETQKSLRVLEKHFLAGERLLAVVDEIGTVIFTRGDTPFELYMRTLSQDDKAAILRAVMQAVPIIQGAHAQLRLAGLEREQIDMRLLSAEIVRALSETDQGSRYLQSMIDTWLPLAAVLPSFLGYPDEKTYLLLLQDTSEVRATGGFISHYGIMKLQNGEITSLKTDNVYNLDDRARETLSIAPPEPFRRHFPRPLTQWFLRDANWAPDYSESARQAELFYRLEGGGERIDGVLAATPELVRTLLRFTGPIRVEDQDYAEHTLIEKLEFEVREGYYRRGIEEGKRKEIFGRLVSSIGEKLLTLPLTEWLALYAALEARLNEKHILLYARDAHIQEFARQRGWTGEIRAYEGDYVMVVDTTFATLKTEGVMDKRISYTLREDAGGFLAARLDFAYTNRAIFTDVTTTYRDWLRVYVPDGSTLVRATGIQSSDNPASEGTLEITKKYGKLEFAGYLTVDPRRTKMVTIEYRLPNRLYQQVRNGRYTLLLQKQPGIANQRLDGHLEFSAPIETYQPLGFFNVRRASGKLDIFHDYRTDQEVEVKF